MVEPDLRTKERLVTASIELLKHDPIYDPLFNLTEVTAGNRKVMPTVLKRMVMDNMSVTFFSESGMGKTTMINLLTSAYGEVCDIVGKDSNVAKNLWDDARDEAIRIAGPANTWEDYRLPNQIQLEHIANTQHLVQINEVVAKGYGEGLWDAGASVLEKQAKERRDMIFINIPQEDGMQLLTDSIREAIRAKIRNGSIENAVTSLEEIGIKVKGVDPTEAADKALRSWAQQSGLRKHMDLKRREEKEILDHHLDYVPYRPDLKHHHMPISPPPSEYLRVKVPTQYLDFLKFLGIVDLEQVETAIGELKLNAAMGLTTLKRLNIKGNDGFVVFNIPKVNNRDGLTIPSPISI
ncbi:MAG TPA: hypothetical protein VHE53_03685 [Patescibacteria group bacterium]|nr:hypothetical protein [Patescibacteria group bacterium]